MKLEKIDKARYRKHLNQVIVACIIVLVSGALGIAQLLIALFPSPDGSHFHWNLTGVVVTCLAIGAVLKHYKNHSYMTEVSYVWDLKQQLNQINRVTRQLKQAVDKGDVEAMQILNYAYAGSRLLWQLDDNTITMEELAIWQAELNVKADAVNLVLDVEKFDPTRVANYK